VEGGQAVNLPQSQADSGPGRLNGAQLERGRHQTQTERNAAAVTSWQGRPTTPRLKTGRFPVCSTEVAVVRRGASATLPSVGYKRQISTTRAHLVPSASLARQIATVWGEQATTATRGSTHQDAFKQPGLTTCYSHLRSTRGNAGPPDAPAASPCAVITDCCVNDSDLRGPRTRCIRKFASERSEDCVFWGL